MNHDRIYYRIEQNSPMMERIKILNDAHKKARKAAYDFCEKNGATANILKQGNRVSALHFENDPGDGWRLYSRDNYFKGGDLYKPNLRTKLGRSINAEMKALSFPDGFRNSDILQVPCVFSGRRIIFLQLEELAGVVVLGIPLDSKKKYEPLPGMIELKASELLELQAAEARSIEKAIAS